MVATNLHKRNFIKKLSLKK